MPEPYGRARSCPKVAPADRKGLTGFGSFGKPAVLRERLARILAAYTDDAPTGSAPSEASAPCHAAWALMAHLNTALRASTRPPLVTRNRMAGFFLYREDGRIQMRVLTPDGWSHPFPRVR